MQPHAPIEPQGTFDGLRPGAILLGALVDIALSLVVSLLLVAWLQPEILEASEAEAHALLAELNGRAAYVAAGIATGALGTLVGAFVGARNAGQLHVRHGGWIAVTSAALGALLVVGEPPPPETAAFPFWAEVLSYVLILPAGLAGGALARRTQAR